MDSQSSEPTSLQQTAVNSDKDNTSKKGKLIKGLGGIVCVTLIAGATYAILSLAFGQKPTAVEKVATVEKADTPETIDSQVQSYMDSEQKLEDALSNSESQTVVDDANSTQSLEGNYGNY
ncbi:MAG: hypothetical protein Q7T74_04285 [Candidatus Saccharibacteria bacterium]|nr:hypothetical protein [Candidatus Saccharibacteria bacterium]